MDDNLKVILRAWEEVGGNNDIEDLLSEIERKNQAVERFRGDEMTQGQFAEIIQDIQFEFVYNSNAIEGNALSLRETRELLKVSVEAEREQRGRIRSNSGVRTNLSNSRLKDEVEARSLFEATEELDRILRSKQEFRLNHVREIHYILMAGIAPEKAGSFRQNDVVIQGSAHTPPSHVFVERLMQDLIDWYRESQLHPIVKASAFHHAFTWIHPFHDGNGRIGRLLLNLCLIQAHYVNIVLPLERRTDYYEALSKLDRHDGTGGVSFIKLVINCLNRILDKYLERVRSNKQQEDAREKFSLDTELQQLEGKAEAKERYRWVSWQANVSRLCLALKECVEDVADENEGGRFGIKWTEGLEPVSFDEYSLLKRGADGNKGKWVAKWYLHNYVTKDRLSVVFSLEHHQSWRKFNMFDTLVRDSDGNAVYRPVKGSDRVSLRVIYKNDSIPRNKDFRAHVMSQVDEFLLQVLIDDSGEMKFVVLRRDGDEDKKHWEEGVFRCAENHVRSVVKAFLSIG